MKTEFASAFLPNRMTALALGVALSMAALGSAQAYEVNAGKVYNSAGQRVHLNGVNWFGFETTTHAPHGLWARNADDMIAQMKALRINAVRLPVAPGTLSGKAINGVDFFLNPDLIGKNSLQTLDAIVNKLNDAGMYILLDHHRPDDYAISELWYTDNYSEAQWIADLELMAARYKNVPYVFAIDLKNEPHGRATWGTGNISTDWNLAAERAAAAVLAKNPNLLVFVAGIEDQPTCSGPHAHGWGGNLEPLRCMPLAIPQNKLVLAPHFYGPDVYMHTYFSAVDFPANMPAIWNTHFGFAKDMGYAVIPTEFGSRYGHDGGLELDKIWFDAAIDWMVKKGLNDGFFWSWNPNSHDTGGLLQNDWTSIWSDKLAKLHTLWAGTTTAPQPLPPGDTTAPMLQSVNVSGTRLVLVYDESLNAGSVPAAAQFVIKVNRRNVNARSISIDGSNVTLNLAQAVLAGQQVTVAYNAPTLKPIEDSAGNDAASFAERSVTNTTPVLTQNPALLTGDELRVQRTVDADWSAGYCVSYTVRNTSQRVGTWETSFGFVGRLDNAWGAITHVDGRSIRARGEGWNTTLNPGGQTTFGYCATRPVVTPSAVSGGGFQTQVSSLGDWGTGYCSAVRVTNTSSSVAAWRVTVPLQGQLANTWSARLTPSNGQVDATGEDWNAYLQPGASTEFGFCANR